MQTYLCEAHCYRDKIHSFYQIGAGVPALRCGTTYEAEYQNITEVWVKTIGEIVCFPYNNSIIHSRYGDERRKELWH